MDTLLSTLPMRLASWYKPYACNKHSTQIKCTNQWCNRPRWLTPSGTFVISAGFFRFSLTNNLSLIAYLLTHKKNALLGDNHNAYLTNFNSSMHNNLEFTQHKLYKSYSWAISPYMQDAPFCAVAIYLRWKTTGTCRWCSIPTSTWYIKFPQAHVLHPSTGRLTISSWQGHGQVACADHWDSTHTWPQHVSDYKPPYVSRGGRNKTGHTHCWITTKRTAWMTYLS